MGCIGRITPLSCPSKFWKVVFESPCCGLWSVLATRPWVRRLAGRPQGLSSTCGGLYSSVERWGETRNKHTSQLVGLKAATSERVAPPWPVSSINALVLTMSHNISSPRSLFAHDKTQADSYCLKLLVYSKWMACQAFDGSAGNPKCLCWLGCFQVIIPMVTPDTRYSSCSPYKLQRIHNKSWGQLFMPTADK